MWTSESPRSAGRELGLLKRPEQPYRLDDIKVNNEQKAYKMPVKKNPSPLAYLTTLCQGDTALVKRLSTYHKSPERAIEVLLSDRGIGQAEIKSILAGLD
jgi:hypothetical protein